MTKRIKGCHCTAFPCCAAICQETIFWNRMWSNLLAQFKKILINFTSTIGLRHHLFHHLSVNEESSLRLRLHLTTELNQMLAVIISYWVRVTSGLHKVTLMSFFSAQQSHMKMQLILEETVSDMESGLGTYLAARCCIFHTVVCWPCST